MPGQDRAAAAEREPITALVTTNASSASAQDQPSRTPAIAATTTDSAVSAPRATASTRSGAQGPA